jgi:hypothetical protein
MRLELIILTIYAHSSFNVNLDRTFPAGKELEPRGKIQYRKYF